MQYSIYTYIHIYTHIHTAGASDESERVLFVKNVVGKTFVVRNAVDVNSTKNSGVFPLCTYIHTYMLTFMHNFVHTYYIHTILHILYAYCEYTWGQLEYTNCIHTFIHYMLCILFIPLLCDHIHTYSTHSRHISFIYTS